MAKSSKYNKKRRQAPARRGLIPLLLVLGGAILMIGVVIFAMQPPAAQATSAVPEVTGTPRLKADKQKVDLGNVKLGVPQSVSFKLTNVGDQTLQFTKAPYVELIEGC